MSAYPRARAQEALHYAFAPTREVFTAEKVAWESLNKDIEDYPYSSAEGPRK